MKKVILKLFAIIFFLILCFVGYFSLIGFETKSFNNQIKENLKKIDSKLDVKINDVKIILDLFNLKINTMTLGPIISYNNKSIDLELIKSEIKLNYTHDQSLIGGLVVQIGSTMIDTSIKKKLQQLETRMIEA